MKKYIFSLILCFFLLNIYGKSKERNIDVIPEPVSIELQEGKFSLPERITITLPKVNKLKPVIKDFKNRLLVTAGLDVITTYNTFPNCDIELVLNKALDKEIGQEGYRLKVNKEGVIIRANSANGLFYGLQTLIQLLPKEIESNTFQDSIEWSIPFVEITDYPRFKWRGLMFDVARHFFTKNEVKGFIDNMVKYKFNILHLHLTDDQGWRIEIKGLPKLTEVGAWNVKKIGTFGAFSEPSKDAPRNNGGFYTQEDIREIIQYAKARFVDILPEIDVPAHCLAAVAAYPELSCTPEAREYQVNSGEPFMDFSHGSPPMAMVDNTLCPAKEEVYTFLDKIFTQVAALFPFDYIHIGGDEAPYNFWEKSSEIRKLMKREKLNNMYEVQSYFTKRVAEIITSKGKQMIGWEEIIKGNRLPKATVMSWRGLEAGVKAANLDHEVIMAPRMFVYLDLMQGDPLIEPPVYSQVLLSKTYKFDPLPDNINPNLVKGGQANLWTEQIYNMRHAQYMLWPRGMAVAEALWSPKEKRNWNDFVRRVEQHFKRFDIAQIKYAPSMYEPVFKVSFIDDKKIRITLKSQIDWIDFYYSFDNSFPDLFYPKYNKPIIAPEDATTFRVIAYDGKHPKGRMISIPIEKLKKRALKNN